MRRRQWSFDAIRCRGVLRFSQYKQPIHPPPPPKKNHSKKPQKWKEGAISVQWDAEGRGAGSQSAAPPCSPLSTNTRPLSSLPPAPPLTAAVVGAVQGWEGVGTHGPTDAAPVPARRRSQSPPRIQDDKAPSPKGETLLIGEARTDFRGQGGGKERRKDADRKKPPTGRSTSGGMGGGVPSRRGVGGEPFTRKAGSVRWTGRGKIVLGSDGV